MNIHTRLVGAFDAIILSLTVAVMVAALLDVSFSPSEEILMGKRGTVTIQQIAVNDTVTVRRL